MSDVFLEKNIAAQHIINSVKEYFKDKEHQKAFEHWYKEKYGEDYGKQNNRKSL